jgi:hypothetical protein
MSAPHSNYFQPGDVHNPSGRPSGSRNKRTVEVLELIKAAGHQDPLLTLAELQANSTDEGIRATAANMLAPYMHSKMGPKPQPPDPVYIEQAISLPKPTSIAIACENIARLTEMKNLGQLDMVTADSLIADQRFIAHVMVEELKALKDDKGTRPLIIDIRGGLPLLPGTNIIMPKMNGHDPDPEPQTDTPDPQT